MPDKEVRRHNWFRDLPWGMVLIAAVLMGMLLAYACNKFLYPMPH